MENNPLVICIIIPKYMYSKIVDFETGDHCSCSWKTHLIQFLLEMKHFNVLLFELCDTLHILHIRTLSTLFIVYNYNSKGLVIVFFVHIKFNCLKLQLEPILINQGLHESIFKYHL